MMTDPSIPPPPATGAPGGLTDAKTLFRKLPALRLLTAAKAQTDTSGPQYYCQYDPNNGKLQYLTIQWPSGVTTVIFSCLKKILLGRWPWQNEMP